MAQIQATRGQALLGLGVIILTAGAAVKYSDNNYKKRQSLLKQELIDTYSLSSNEMNKFDKRVKAYQVSWTSIRDSLALDKRITDTFKAGAQSVRDSIKNAKALK